MSPPAEGARGARAPQGAKARRAQATRGALTAAARELFAEQGFDAVATEEVVRRAGVTRGALYHHFADKRDLFRAVVESLEQELVERIAEAMQKAAEAGSTSAADGLRVAAGAFLDACEDPGFARIAAIEAPTVLGWAEWREIDARYGLGLAIAALEAGMAAGELRSAPVRPLAHLLVAALGEAGIVVATAEEPAAARAEMEQALAGLIDGLAT